MQCSKNLTVIPGSTRNRKVEVGKPRFAALKRVQGDREENLFIILSQNSKSSRPGGKFIGRLGILSGKIKCFNLRQRICAVYPAKAVMYPVIVDNILILVKIR